MEKRTEIDSRISEIEGERNMARRKEGRNGCWNGVDRKWKKRDGLHKYWEKKL